MGHDASATHEFVSIAFRIITQTDFGTDGVRPRNIRVSSRGWQRAEDGLKEQFAGKRAIIEGGTGSTGWELSSALSLYRSVVLGGGELAGCCAVTEPITETAKRRNAQFSRSCSLPKDSILEFRSSWRGRQRSFMLNIVEDSQHFRLHDILLTLLQYSYHKF